MFSITFLPIRQLIILKLHHTTEDEKILNKNIITGKHFNNKKDSQKIKHGVEEMK